MAFERWLCAWNG